jgi:hypothetical protein
MDGIPIVVPVRFAGRGLRSVARLLLPRIAQQFSTGESIAAKKSLGMLHAPLWATQWMLAAVFEFAGLLKACVPAEDLQHKLRFATDAPAAILRPVGVLEIIASLALILPAATQFFPRLTPIAATCLTVIAMRGAFIHASGCALGETLPDLVLAAAAAFVAWGRFGRASITPFSHQSTGREGARPSMERFEEPAYAQVQGWQWDARRRIDGVVHALLLALRGLRGKHDGLAGGEARLDAEVEADGEARVPAPEPAEARRHEPRGDLERSSLLPGRGRLGDRTLDVLPAAGGADEEGAREGEVPQVKLGGR